MGASGRRARRPWTVRDRRFNRARYNADLILDTFAARLQDTVDLGTVRDELANAVHVAFEPAHLTIWTRELWPAPTRRGGAAEGESSCGQARPTAGP